MKSLLIIFVLLPLISSAAIEFPIEFTYKRKLIDPYCFSLANNQIDIDLDKCTDAKLSYIYNYQISDYGYGYSFKDANNINLSSTINYAYLGKINNFHVVQVSSLGAEFSRLTFIKYFSLKNNVLHLVKSGPAGDRAFGGVKDAYVESNNLYYTLNMNPLTFMNYFNKNENIKNVINNLEDCAICYFAELSFKNNIVLGAKFKDFVLKDNPNDNKDTKCFKDVHQKYINQNKLDLDLNQIEEFMKNFEMECASVN